jgi:hypothetical protein
MEVELSSLLKTTNHQMYHIKPNIVSFLELLFLSKTEFHPAFTRQNITTPFHHRLPVSSPLSPTGKCVENQRLFVPLFLSPPGFEYKQSNESTEKKQTESGE